MRFSIALTLLFAVVSTASCFGGDASSTPDASTASVTFYKDVDPILQNHCQSCHVAGGIAPFPLLTYDDAHANAAAIASDTQGRIMPPWGALDTSECTPRFPWSGDMRLSQTEIDTLKAWHDQGDAPGNPADAPPPITTTPSDDLPGATSLTPATAFTLTQSSDYFRCFVLDPQITTPGTYLTGTNVKPGNRTIVHHALVFSVPANATIPPPTDGVADQYDCFGGTGVAGQALVAAWAPGGVPYQYPTGVAHPLDVGTKLIMQVHYHPHANATSDPDATTFQFTTTTTKPQWTLTTALVGNFTNAVNAAGNGLENPPFLIPADTANVTFTMQFTYPSKLPAVRLLGIGAHMHLVGTDELVTIKRAAPVAPDPASECLLQTPQWNFNWQRSYQYATDMTSLPSVSPGDVIEMRCTYDNTMSNPLLAEALGEAQKTQTQPVSIGETTLDEMCLGAFWFVYPTP